MPEATQMNRAERWQSWLVTLGILGAMLWPLSWPKGSDSFPLSTYPMFARDVSREPPAWMARALAYDARGRHTTLPPHLVANEEVLQAHRTLIQAIEGGPETLQSLCQGMLARMAQEPKYARFKRIEIVSQRFDAIDYFSGHAQPLESRLHGRCGGEAAAQGARR